ncbi:hypothetical protein [Micromonospora globbae]|jgi:hypothetical protein|uniref:Uncharacterized protein n=1 Tax=Micromonospora globbae TaxID=1894969 RepID=A0A420F5W5_9ACTN|nr:hypothetical protein [Micromonospora globbae]RKF28312.1 hypothetical protein D7I43_04565 [Micromonospora globbae]WTF84854.1 hypothetical protein OH732_24575 [Micromonospora globbae]
MTSTKQEYAMFGTDPDFILSLHRAHAAELRAEAAADRLARSLPRRGARGWFGRRHQARDDDRR